GQAPNLIIQIGPVSNTTTTTTLSTTTTLASACEIAVTFPSIDCRLDRLIAEVHALGDLGKLTRELALSLQAAKARTAASEQTAAQGRRPQAKASLAKARRALGTFIARLRSPHAHRILPPNRPTMLGDTARLIRSDMRSIGRGI